MENPHILIGKSTNSMAMFNSKLLVYQGVSAADFALSNLSSCNIIYILYLGK